MRVAGEDRWASTEDAARLRDALGVSLPPGLAESLLQPAADPLGDLVTRYARTHVPFASADLAAHYGLGRAVATDALRRLVQTGRLVEGDLLPVECGGRGGEFCDAEVLRVLRRRSVTRSSRSSRGSTPASCPGGRAWGAACADATACCGPSSS